MCHLNIWCKLTRHFIFLLNRNKDFLKEVLSGTKRLLKLKDLKPVHVPQFDELSDQKLWKEMKDDEAFLSYFPSKLPKQRLPCRSYFFNILNTLMDPYLTEIMKHASLMRNSAVNEAMADQTIEVTDDWY